MKVLFYLCAPHPHPTLPLPELRSNRKGGWTDSPTPPELISDFFFFNLKEQGKSSGTEARKQYGRLELSWTESSSYLGAQVDSLTAGQNQCWSLWGDNLSLLLFCFLFFIFNNLSVCLFFLRTEHSAKGVMCPTKCCHFSNYFCYPNCMQYPMWAEVVFLYCVMCVVCFCFFFVCNVYKTHTWF